MVEIRAFSMSELYDHLPGHTEVGDQIKLFLQDIGENCDIVLEFDNPEGPFQYLFTGTTLSLEFDYDGISVLDYNVVTDEELTLAVFDTHEINKAIHWLLTQANQAN